MDNFLIGQKIVLTADARFAPFKCLHCPKLFINKITLDKHWIKHHPHTYDYQNGSLFFQDDEIYSQNKKQINGKNSTLVSQIGQFRLDRHNENVTLLSKAFSSNNADSNIYSKKTSLVENNANLSRQNVRTHNRKNESSHLKRRQSRTKVLNQSTSYSLETKNKHVQTDKTTPWRSHYGSIPLISNSCNCCFGTCNAHFQDIQKTNNVMCNTVNNFTSKCDESSQTSSCKNNTFISNAFRTREASTITKPENISTQTNFENTDTCKGRKEIIITNYVVQTNVTTQTSLNRSTNTHGVYSKDEVDFCNSENSQLNMSTQTKFEKNKTEGHFNEKVQTFSNENEHIMSGSSFKFTNTVPKFNATTQTYSSITEIEKKFPNPEKQISQINETTQTYEKNEKQLIMERKMSNLTKDVLQINTTTQTLTNKNEISSVSVEERAIYPHYINKLTQTDIKTNKKVYFDISTQSHANFIKAFNKQEHSAYDEQSNVHERASQVEELQMHGSFSYIPSQENKCKINKKYWDECIQACLDKYDSHSFDISAPGPNLFKKKWDEYSQTCLEKPKKVHFDPNIPNIETNSDFFGRSRTQYNKKTPDEKQLDECIQTCLGKNENRNATFTLLKPETKSTHTSDTIEKQLNECTQVNLDESSYFNTISIQNQENLKRPESQHSVNYKSNSTAAHINECIQTCVNKNEKQVVEPNSVHIEQTIPDETDHNVYLKSDSNKEQFDECIQTCLTNENQIDVISAQNEENLPKLGTQQYNVSLKNDTNKDNVECIQTCLITHENKIFDICSGHNEKTIPQLETLNIVSNKISMNKKTQDECVQILCRDEKQSSGIEQNERSAEPNICYKYTDGYIDKCVQISFDTTANISSANNIENPLSTTQSNISSNCNEMLPKSVYTLANLKPFEITNRLKKLLKLSEILPVVKSDLLISEINTDQNNSSRSGEGTKDGNANNEKDKSSTPTSSQACSQDEDSISEESSEQKNNDDLISNQNIPIALNNYKTSENLSSTVHGTSENVKVIESEEPISQNQVQTEPNSLESERIKRDFHAKLTELGIDPDWNLLKDEAMQKSLELLNAKRMAMKKRFSSLREKIRYEVDCFVKEKMLNNTIK